MPVLQLHNSSVKNSLILLSACFAFPFLLKSENSVTPRIINFTKIIYKAQNQIWAIAQSPDERLYFGNNDGLIEYDGARWQTYKLPNKQIVRSVSCDASGRIFTGGFGEFGYWAPHSASGQLQYHSLSRKLANESIAKEEIWHILPHDKSVFFQSFGVIYRYDFKTVEEIRPPDNIMFLQSVGSDLVAPVIGKGLYRWTPSAGFSFIKGSELFAASRVIAILAHGDKWLVCTENQGIFAYDGQSFAPWTTPAQSALRANQLNKAIRLANGWIALGTILNGVYLLDDTGRIVYHLNRENGLQNNTVLALRQDRAGDLWVGLDKGVDLIALSDPLTYYQDRSGKIGAVYAAAIHQGLFYAGTNQGLYAKSLSGGDFQLVNRTQGQVWELYQDDSSLLCGHNDGTFAINGLSADKISPITGGWQLLPWPGSDYLLQATYTGLALLGKDPQGQRRLSHRIEGFVEPIRFMGVDSRKRVLAANQYKGLYLIELDPSLQRISRRRELSAADGLPTPFKIRIVQLQDRLLVQADTLVFAWDETRKKLTYIKEYRGISLTGGNFRIVPGRDGEWFKAYPNRLEWYRHGEFLGRLSVSLVPDFECVIPLDDSTYLFCLDNGYALLKRPLVPENAGQIPAPLISRIELLNATQTFAGNSPDVLQLGPAMNGLHFVYSLPFYTQPPLFQSRLVGFQNEWSAWSESASREFTNLPPGNYVFEVRANLSDAVRKIAFEIEPHWYETRWARILMLAALLALLIAFLVWNQHRFERHRRQVEMDNERQLQQERIKVRNEQLQSDIINKSQELANSTFNLVRKNEILMQIKEALNDIKGDLGARLPDKYHQRLIHLIDSHLESEHDWQVFETNFTQVHEVFFKHLKEQFPDLTPGDLRLAAYLKMNLASKEIAPLLNISIRGVENKRYRLRHKLGLPSDANLTEFLMGF